MASPGNSNHHHHQQINYQFDLQNLLNSSPSFPTPSSSSSPPSSSSPSSSSYPPPTGIFPFYPQYLPYQQPQEQPYILQNQPPQMHAPQRSNFQSPSSQSLSSSSSEFALNVNSNQISVVVLPASPSSGGPTRMLSSKVPRGRHLIGENVVYDIDVRLQGEVQPQLEVTPITKYASDPCLVLGRQIAVNRSYICYGLKLGAIRVLNINTALRYLLRGHTQRVTDMAFFAEDLHLLASASTDGRIFVWKINEGPDEEDKPQITGKVIIALQILGAGESVHPRVCWHPHKQEILMVAIGNRILKIDAMKVGKGETFSAEEPLKCSIDKLIDGVQLVGKHDGDVTELSMCQWMKSRLASASADGTVKIWEERKASPLAVLRPHDGNPVNSVTFLTAPHRPDHIVLITAGPLNKEVKIWVSDNEEGWLLPNDSESWNCVQTLAIKSSSEANPEDAFFNQVVALSRAGLILLANSKKNTIYAVHIEYGPNPTATRMDYIAEFTVTMPILSLTGTSDCLPDGEHIVQIYCVQTQAIQQYALNLSQCLPPPLDNIEFEKMAPSRSRAFDGSTNTDAVNMPQVHASNSESGPIHSLPVSLSSSDISGLPEGSASGTETKPYDVPSHNGVEHIQPASPNLPLSPRLSRKLSDLRSPSNNIETTSPSAGHRSEQTHIDGSVEQRMESEKDSMRDVPPSVDSLTMNGEQNEGHVASNTSTMFKHPTHLVTPSEIFSTAALSSENSLTSQGISIAEAKVQDVVAFSDAVNAELELKVASETSYGQDKTESDRERDTLTTVAGKREKLFYSQASDLGIQLARETRGVEGVGMADDTNNIDTLNQTSSPSQQESQDMSKVVAASLGELETTISASQSPELSEKGKKQKDRNSQVSGSEGSSNYQGGNSEGSTMEVVLPQLSAMQEMLGQLLSMQKEMQKQMNTIVSVPVTKEGKRLEGSLGKNMEKVVKSNSDALWARFLEENVKQEKLEQDRAQQITNLISNYVNKDLSTQLEKIIKKEISSIGTTVARSVSQIIEKTISSTVMESFQKGLGDKTLNQLEKSVSSKLEATLARQIQSQFQTSGKQALQEALKSSLEASMIPAFETSCKAMFEQIDVAFQNGLVQHSTAIQQQYDSTHSPLVMTLRDTINSASTITKTLSGQLADGVLKLSEIAATSKGADTSVTQISNGLHEIAEDPTKELSRLISERKFEEAFTGALLRSDVSIVSWLCSQVDLAGILSMVPLPLSQGVLLSLLQQLSCDLNSESPRKLAWMTDVATLINPADPSIAVHVRPILEQVSQTLGHRRSLSTTSSSEASAIRLLMHVINSVLLSCK